MKFLRHLLGITKLDKERISVLGKKKKKNWEQKKKKRKKKKNKKKNYTNDKE